MERPQPVLSGELLTAVAETGPMSRASLLSASGLSRATVTQRLNAFIASGLLMEADEMRPSGGRPSRLVCLNAEAALVLAANIGESHIRLAATNLDLAVKAQVTIAFSIDEGPEGTLELLLSADATIALDVECIEAQLADTGGAWETGLKPRHPAV